MATKIYIPRHKGYSESEIMNQLRRINEIYGIDKVKHISRGYSCNISLQPTDLSCLYKVKIVFRIGQPRIKVFVCEPCLRFRKNEKMPPHMYRDNSLCLYYPGYREWSKNDNLDETIIPWTALWLFYYEIWEVTGQWKGGGKHPV